MKFVFAVFFLFVAVQLSESFFFQKATTFRPTQRHFTQRVTQRPFSGRPFAASANQDPEAVILEGALEFVQKNIVTPFIENILKPLQNRVLKPLEENLKQKLADFKLNTVPEIKNFIKSNVIDPAEKAFTSLKEKVHQYIETFGKLISKESRDEYKRRISEFIDTKLRQPLLERVKKLLQKIENELEEKPSVADVQPVYFDTIKEFIESNIIIPFINNVVKPIEDRIIRPLEQNFKQKLSELNLVTIPQIKQFFKDSVISPLESGFQSLKDKVSQYIETFGKLISKENREYYKQQFADFIDTKIRQPLLARVQKLLEKVENQLGESVYDAEPVFLETIKEFVQDKIVTPFINKVVKPIEERIIRPLEQNLKQKLSELKLVTIPQIKQFFKDSVLAPLESGFQSLKEKVSEYIETFGKLISKENRELYKQKISEFIETKIRQPILERVKIILEKVERGLDN